MTTWGAAGLFALKLALLAMTLTMAAAIHRLESDDQEPKRSAGILFLLGLPACYLLLNAYVSTVQCHAFSILGYVAFLWILDGYRRFPSTRAPWLLPPLLAVWINMHGGFVLGLFAIGVHLLWLVAERRKQQAIELSIVALFCLGALLLNPYGWRFVPKIIEAWSMSRVEIVEWGNVFGNGPLYGWIYVALVCSTLSAAAVNAWRDRRFPGALILLAATAVQGFLHAKLVPFFLVTMLALGSAEFLRLIPRYDIPRRVADFFCLLLPSGIAAAAVTLIVLQFASGDKILRPRVPGWNAAAGEPADQNHYPIGAVSLLAEMQGPVNLWCPLHWGKFISWSLYPNVRVSMDGRFETVFPAPVRADHLRFWTGARDVSVASDYDTTHILVPADDVATLAAVDASSWVRIYQDPIAVLYARTALATAPAARDNSSTFVGDVVGDLSRFAHR
ncbi:MAG: hypothetical protein O3A53_13190 [Acidobacteria bacterium]|nr:hypothetical protein [Acidobacteriota bacterium]